MLNAVEPKSVTEVKAFTGMVNDYAKFIGTKFINFTRSYL